MKNSDILEFSDRSKSQFVLYLKCLTVIQKGENSITNFLQKGIYTDKCKHMLKYDYPDLLCKV